MADEAAPKIDHASKIEALHAQLDAEDNVGLSATGDAICLRILAHKVALDVAKPLARTKAPAKKASTDKK